MASHAHECSSSCSTPVARGGRSDVVAAQRWGSRGGDDSRQHVAGRDGVVSRAVTVAAGDPSATGERVSPGLGGPVGGLAAPGAVAYRALCARTLACGAIVGGGSLRVAAGHAEGRMKPRGRAAAASGIQAIDNNG